MDSGMTQSCLQEAIRGKIGDPQALPVASARVVMSGSKLGQKIATCTGSEGHFLAALAAKRPWYGGSNWTS